MPTFIVTGRIRAYIEFSEIVKTQTEDQAIEVAEQRVYARCGINKSDVIDDEIYCEEQQCNEK